MESDEIGPKQSLENLLPVLKGAEQFEWWEGMWWKNPILTEDRDSLTSLAAAWGGNPGSILYRRMLLISSTFREIFCLLSEGFPVTCFREVYKWRNNGTAAIVSSYCILRSRVPHLHL
jgi:hypothetical protein